MRDMIKIAADVKPSKRQLQWQQVEFYSFFHFGINTFTDSEWGHGNEDPKIFNPVNLDATQWVSACKAAGMKGVLLTCKHHDGFCLWPSKYTDYSVKSTPWKDGKGDVVREVSEACKEFGLKFGIYLSPWDMHEKCYGDSEKYNEYFLNQLTELLSEYGEIFSVWFDGACGEGPNGKRQVYDWTSYYSLIRQLQPNAVISICGPDVRWCGNEAGSCRNSEWSVVPSTLYDAEKIQDESQKSDNTEFRNKIKSVDEDLGSRNVIENVDNLIWYPCEVDTSIRPGWFYHSNEDDKIKSLDELLKIYYSSIGGNATLLLNIPPDTNGLLHKNDVIRLKELGKALTEAFKLDFTSTATAIASETQSNHHNINNVFNDDTSLFWCPKEGTEEVTIQIDLNQNYSFDKILLSEHIESGQRIEAFVIEYLNDNQWTHLYTGTTIGYKKICLFNKVEAQHVRIRITHSRWCPTLQRVGIY